MRRLPERSEWLNATYSPSTPDDLVEELRALAESATFEVP